MEKINKEQAINLIKQVCSQYKGNLSEHSAIQEAIKCIEDELKVETKKEEDK